MPHHTTLDLAYHRDGTDVVVDLDGELDFATAPNLRHGLFQLIDDQGNLFVTLDLANLSFLDAAGLSVLIQARRRLLELGGSIALRSPSRSARRLLAITGLDADFGLADQGNTRDSTAIDLRAQPCPNRP